MQLLINVLGWAVVAIGAVVAAALVAFGALILVIGWRQH